MRRRTFTVDAGPRGRALLGTALARFAEAAYPPGGSECAQVARETLLTTAAQIAEAERPAISTRQRALLRQAVSWHVEQLDGLTPQQAEQLGQALLSLLKGDSVADADLPSGLA